jgi:xanthine/uracil/vitamin C permease (AzgA family)
MAAGVARINWADPADGLSAFLCMVMMPFTFSIADGIGFGLLAFTLTRIAQRRRARRGRGKVARALFNPAQHRLLSWRFAPNHAGSF